MLFRHQLKVFLFGYESTPESRVEDEARGEMLSAEIATSADAEFLDEKHETETNGLHDVKRRSEDEKFDKHYRVSGLDIMRYLLAEGNKCPFGKASASFALALITDDPKEAMELVQEGQKWLFQYNHKDKIYDLMTTKWPIWRLLHLLQQRLFFSARDKSNILEKKLDHIKEEDANYAEKNPENVYSKLIALNNQQGTNEYPAMSHIDSMLTRFEEKQAAK